MKRPLAPVPGPPDQHHGVARWRELDSDQHLAPKVQLTAPIARLSALTSIKWAMKLREAGIQLWGLDRVHDFVPYWNAMGFDFMCDNWQALLDAASKAPRLGTDFIDMPGSDNWRSAGVKSAPALPR